jgi:hypothetical protein
MTDTDSVIVLTDHPENSVRINWDIGLEPKFNDLLDAMTEDTIVHHDIYRPRPSSGPAATRYLVDRLVSKYRCTVQQIAWPALPQFVPFPFRPSTACIAST